MTGEALIVLTAWASLAPWSIGLALLWSGHVRTARFIYTLGLLAFFVHVACAFHFSHGWSHAAAVAHTADQSEALTGVRAGWGLWLNYLFGLAWLFDALCWWRLGDARYSARRGAGKLALRLFGLFIFFNGAVVFVAGPRRWIGIALGMILLGSASRLLLSPDRATAGHK